MTIAAQQADMPRYRCFSHTLNLASQRALKLPAVSRLLGRVRRVTTFFRRSTVASHVLSEKQALLNLPHHKLITDVATRWNSAHDMLECFLEQQPAIHAALLSTEVCKSEKEICTLTDSDITTATGCRCHETNESGYTRRIGGGQSNAVDCSTTPCPTCP